MNYLLDLHFVGVGRRRGFPSGENHDDEDGDEEESEDGAHHSSGHDYGVGPLRLRLVWDRAHTHRLPVYQKELDNYLIR